MKYKVRYEEVHTFQEFVEADSKKEAILKVMEEKELRLDFLANGLMEWEEAAPQPIEIQEEQGSYRAIRANVCW